MNEKLPAVIPAADVSANETEYPLLRPDAGASLLEVFHDNMGEAGLSSLDLQRIKVPSGGILSWSVGTLDGEESAKELDGIVLAWSPGRLYWKKAFGEGGGRKPPDCTSANGFTGVGDPGGPCAQCPYAVFGSAPKGHGQACKQIRKLLIVRPGEILPHLLTVPPTSLKAASQYFLMLLAQQIPYWGVTTRLRLERATNEDGIAYAKMQFFKGRRLEKDECAALRPFHLQMQTMLAALPVDISDYEVAPAAGETAPRDEDVPF